VNFRIVAGEFERDGIRMATHDRRVALGHLARPARQPRLARRQAGALAANVTSSSGAFAIARKQAVTARLNGSVGASFDPVRNLVLDVVIVASPRGQR